MKKLPIPYSNEMVRSLLRREKTMTRRIINTQRYGWDCHTMKFARVMNITEQNLSERYQKLKKTLIGFHAFFFEPGASAELGIRCPYGQPGDVLWVKETYCPTNGMFLHKESHLPYVYKADVNEPYPGYEKKKMTELKWRWKSGRFMPMEAARIWLRIKSIGVERLQDITTEDAIREGIEKVCTHEGNQHYRLYGTKNCHTPSAIGSFASLIEKIHGKEQMKSNPWVWVIEFEVLSVKGMPEELRDDKDLKDSKEVKEAV